MVYARHYHNKGSHIQKGNKRNASNLTYHRQLCLNKKFQQCKKIPFNNNKKVKSPLWRFTVSRLKKSERERKICDGSVFIQVHNFDAQLSEEKPTFLISVRTFFLMQQKVFNPNRPFFVNRILKGLPNIIRFGNSKHLFQISSWSTKNLRFFWYRFINSQSEWKLLQFLSQKGEM